MERVNEGTTAYLTLSFKDKAGALEAPSAVTYSIVDVESGEVIRPSTTIPPADTVEVRLTTSDTSLVYALSVAETRRVTVVATYGEGDAVTGQVEYEVVNLAGV